MATELSQGQVAEIVGLTARRLQQLDKAGEGPERNAGGGYPPVALGRWVRDRLLGELGVANDGQAYDYAAERARLTKAQADKTELEVAELRGDLISTPSALAQVEAMVAGMRTKLLALPVKVAAQAGATPAEMVKLQELVRVQVYDVLDEIASDGFQDELRRAVDERTEAGVPGILGIASG